MSRNSHSSDLVFQTPAALDTVLSLKVNGRRWLLVPMRDLLELVEVV